MLIAEAPPTTSVRVDRPHWTRRAPQFVVVGVLWTIAYLVMYLGLRQVVDAQWANLIALVLSTIGDTDANRRFTFGVRSASTVVVHQLLGLALLLVGLAITSGSLALLDLAWANATPTAEVVVLVVANGVAGVTRFAAFARWMDEGRESSDQGAGTGSWSRSTDSSR